jgi:hypothetical protein
MWNAGHFARVFHADLSSAVLKLIHPIGAPAP